MPNDRRIDRRIRRPVATAGPAATSNIVTFKDGNGRNIQTFDPVTLGLPADMVGPLMATFRINGAGLSPLTRSAKWRALRRFAGFLSDEGILYATDVNAGTMKRYLAFLARPRGEKRLSRPTIGTQMALIRPLLERAELADPTLFGSALAMPYNPVPGSRIHEAKDRLNRSELRAILSACYAEIDAAWNTFQRGRAIVAASKPPPRAIRGESFESGLWRLHRLTGGLAPTRKQLGEAGIPSSSLFRWGGLIKIAEHFHLTTRTVIPFYLALCIQLAANPDPLRSIQRDCLVPHPIDENRVLVEWLKLKTGQNPKNQRRSFDRRRPRSAPRLVEMVLAMTEPLLPHVPPEDCNRLFLAHYLTGSRHRQHDKLAGLIRFATLAGRIDWFIDNANRRIATWNRDQPDKPRRELPRFTAGQLRGSVATEHYVESGGDLIATAAILNHRDPVTTDAYVEGPAARRHERETIARLQRLMVNWVTSPAKSDAGKTIDASDPVTALFGHTCLMPVETDAGGHTRTCRHLGGCLTCPGLIVPVDADHYARIIQAQRHLINFRDHVDAERWGRFYAPSLRVLEQDLLPAFPVDMRGEAEILMAQLPALPDIE
jgi:hypothetical protein